MGKVHTSISPELREWLLAQPMFFVATAPLVAEGAINCSPKGLDSLRVLGPREVAYVDLTGSGIETIAHLRENGRIVFMFCAFSGAPKIVRLHGRGHVLLPGSPEFELLRPAFPEYPGTRAIVHATVDRVSDSCGYAVPRMDLKAQRHTLIKWAESKGEEGLNTYRRQKNASSIDGLPGIAARESRPT